MTFLFRLWVAAVFGPVCHMLSVSMITDLGGED